MKTMIRLIDKATMMLKAYRKFHRCFVLVLVVSRSPPLQGLIHVPFFCRFYIEFLRHRP
ncbi:hypothetical protein Hanom_Chr17g01529441 [Helianthus anomalus]